MTEFSHHDAVPFDHDSAGYAVAHTAHGRRVSDPGTALDLRAGNDAPTSRDAGPAGWPRVPFAVARERLARGVLVYRVAEVVAILEARLRELEAEFEATTRRHAALMVAPSVESELAPRARLEELRRVIARVGGLVDGDVPTARALARDLSIAAASDAARPDAGFGRAQASAEGSATIQRCLIPHCIVWSGPWPIPTEGELDLLARVMAGVRDVRLDVAGGAGGAGGAGETPLGCTAAGASPARVPVRPIARAEWQAMLAADDARRPSWEQPRGVLLHTPAEVAELLLAEAHGYEAAAGHLRATWGCAGEGEALRHLAADLRREVPRIQALAPGDVHGARELLTDLRREQRDHTRARRRALWRRPVAHLEVVVELVEDFLLPLTVEGGGYVRDRGGASERSVYRRFHDGMLDVRDRSPG